MTTLETFKTGQDLKILDQDSLVSLRGGNDGGGTSGGGEEGKVGGDGGGTPPPPVPQA